jgi:O-antigen/teichoic acid export membrane protein
VAQKNSKILQNTAYTMGGALLMNGVLQVLVYPLLNRHMGSSELGNLLFIMGILAIG